MYRFNIVKNDDSTWRFELNGIQLILDGFRFNNERHYIKTPKSAIGFFSTDGGLYGITNQTTRFATAEELYDQMKKQYAYFQ